MPAPQKPTYAHMPGSGRPPATPRTEQTQAFKRGTVAQPQRTIPNKAATTTVEGTPGPQGDPGPAGEDGARGSLWNSGTGAPATIAGQLNQDLYIDTATNNLYQLLAGTWTLITTL